ncbi:DUF2970 domain-containing protein [Ralstonia sp. R-29]|uniref:DUF2970 domain-containing protein n=1 Tax=Ralstonia sp. R-29 TaxID=3404059 RepID=UPI003CF20354
MDDLKEATKRRASFAQTMKAVFWSFFGVRKGRDHDKDMAQLNPVHVIIAGVLAAVLFVITLLLIVRAVVG